MVDFNEVKARVSFADAITKLALNLKQNGNQWRGECPQCKGGERSLVITESKGFFCFSKKLGGDVIALTAHVRNIEVKQAAEWLAGEQPEAKGFSPLPYIDPAHEAVVAVGFGTEFAQKHGIGFAPKGILRGLVAVPFRDKAGTLLGYIGIDGATLPADFT